MNYLFLVRASLKKLNENIDRILQHQNIKIYIFGTINMRKFMLKDNNNFNMEYEYKYMI